MQRNLCDRPAARLGSQISVDVLLGDPLGRASQPRLDDHFFEILDGDLLEADQDCRVPVEVWGREEDVWVISEQRLLGAQVLYARTEDRAGRRVVAQGAEIRGPERTLPDKSLVADTPKGKAARRSFAALRQREGDSTDIVPTGHA